MKLPKIGDKTTEEGKTLTVTKTFRNNAGYECVEYIDHSGLHGSCILEYWWKKIEEQKRLEEKNKSAGQAGSAAPS